MTLYKKMQIKMYSDRNHYLKIIGNCKITIQMNKKERNLQFTFNIAIPLKDTFM